MNISGVKVSFALYGVIPNEDPEDNLIVYKLKGLSGFFRVFFV